MFDYYTVTDSEQISFYQLPKELVKHERFKVLSDSAKILYVLLRDRVSLSIKNKWVDERGYVYIIFTISEIMENLGCADQKATKSMKELQKLGLIESVRRGQGKPNVIYVKNFATGLKDTNKNLYKPANPMIRDFHESRIVKITNQESLDSRIKIRENHEQSILMLNNIYSINTESESESLSDMTLTIDNDLSTNNKIILQELKKEPLVSTANQSTETKSSIHEDTLTSASIKYNYNTYQQVIQDNIEYSFFVSNKSIDLELVDELVNCMLDVICTAGDTVKIAGEEKSRAMVISQFLKINSQDIDHIIKKYKEQRHKITHTDAYLKTMLYRVKQEANFNLENQVRIDGMV